MAKLISGIQQVGIGVLDVHRAWAWYRKAFGIDVRMFEESAEAALMKSYTGNEVHSRHAALALHMGGGGGLEIWQFTSRTSQPASFEIKMGDTGIFILKIKCEDAEDMSGETGLRNCSRRLSASSVQRKLSARAERAVFRVSIWEFLVCLVYRIILGTVG